MTEYSNYLLRTCRGRPTGIPWYPGIVGNTCQQGFGFFICIVVAPHWISDTLLAGGSSTNVTDRLEATSTHFIPTTAYMQFG